MYTIFYKYIWNMDNMINIFTNIYKIAYNAINKKDRSFIYQESRIPQLV